MNTVSKKASCNYLCPWIKSVAHHFWWACSTCEVDARILREKWLSITFHVQNIHHWTGFTKFHMCCHGPLSTEKQRKKNWLSPTPESFKAFQDIVFSNSILKDLSHLTKFSHTGTLEVYHSFYNRWLPNGIHWHSVAFIHSFIHWHSVAFNGIQWHQQMAFISHFMA